MGCGYQHAKPTNNINYSQKYRYDELYESSFEFFKKE